MTNSIFTQLVVKIIQEQEGIIGPIALEQAQKVPGLKINWAQKEVNISGDEKNTVNELVKQYKQLFGQASVEFCREAVKELISSVPNDKRPSLLS